MGNQPSASSTAPRPIYTVRSDPWPSDNNAGAAATRSTSTEPADSDECHACAARQDSAAVTPTTAATNLSTTTAQPLDTIASVSSLQAASTSTTTSIPLTTPSTTPCYAYSHSACPLNRAELGRAAWAHLHTMAAYYPIGPSATQQRDMHDFMQLYMKQYPCLYCRDRTMEEVERNPPRVRSRAELAVWLCEVHNEVNERLGKGVFDCGRVDERWRTGPMDGSCGG